MVPAGSSPARRGETAVQRADGDGFVVFDLPHPDDVALRYHGPDGVIVLTHRQVAGAVATIAAELALASQDVVAITRKGGVTELEAVVDALAVIRSGGRAAEVEGEAAFAAAMSTSTVLVTSPLAATRALDSPAGRVSVTRVAVRGGKVPSALIAQAAASGVALVRLTGPLMPDGVTVAGRLHPGSPPAQLTGAARARVAAVSGEVALPFTRGVLEVHGVRGPEHLVVQLTDRGVELVDDAALAPVIDALFADPLVRYAVVRQDAQPAVIVAEPRPGAVDGHALASAIERRYGVMVEMRAEPFPLGADGEPRPVEPVHAAEVPTSPPTPQIDGVNVIELWREILDCDDIGPDDNFFALGGDSLKAARVVGQLKKRTGRKISLRTAFKFPTPAGFAAAVHASS